MYLVLRDRSEADRRFVYRALAARLSAGPTKNPERVDLALRALSLCMGEIERPPSRRSYDDWRRAQERPDEWPSSTAIRNTFAGSWRKALDALGVEPTPDVLARRLLHVCRGYEESEVLAAIRGCVEALSADGEELRRLTFGSYKGWACETLANPDRRLRRLPLSTAVFKRHFGSWAQAVAAAGYPELVSPGSVSHRPGPHGPGEAYREERLVEALRRACAALGFAATIPRYDRWRRNQLEQATREGRVLYLPSSQVIQRSFGSWGRALLAVGAITEEEARLYRRRGSRKLTDDEVLEGLVSALAEHANLRGPTLQRIEYRRWRLARLREGAGGLRRPASDTLIASRFGSWGVALARAADELKARTGLDPSPETGGSSHLGGSGAGPERDRSLGSEGQRRRLDQGPHR